MQELNFEYIETDLKREYTAEDLNEIEIYAKNFYQKNMKSIEIMFREISKDDEGNVCRAEKGKRLINVYFPQNPRCRHLTDEYKHEMEQEFPITSVNEKILVSYSCPYNMTHYLQPRPF